MSPKLANLGGLVGSLLLCLCLCLMAPAAARAQLVINEIDYDQPGVDAAEFIEILNVSAEPVNLDPYEVRLVNGAFAVPSIYGIIDLPNVILAPGGYYVICANPGTVVNCDFDENPDTDLIQNGAPDAVAVAIEAKGPIIDTVSYEGNTAGYTEGSGVGLMDGGAANFSGISRFPDGTDTDVNNVDLSPRCITPGAPNTANNTDCPMPQPTGVEESGAGPRPPLPAVAAAPNPLHPPAKITFSLPFGAQVSLTVIDASGRVVRVLADEFVEAGTYRRPWDGRDDRGRPRPSGVYFCRLSTPSSSAVEKLILVR